MLKNKISLDYLFALLVGTIIMVGAPRVGRIVWPIIENCIIDDLPAGEATILTFD